MTQTGTQQTTNKCSRCGNTFDSIEKLGEHEETCKRGSATADEPRVPTAEETKEDMHIEDRFEATDH
jgi:hypothetical protein